MDTPSVTFFALLNEGYRRYYREQQMSANIASLPYMEKQDRSRFLSELNNAAKEPRDIFNTDGLDDYSGLEVLKNLTR